ncbi:hypothetical protein DLAC_11608 [Tieghemostelium lacteum]|uniref:Uncharacterized protein n=1 Tax=Tieghemostelium lacteum TaxID=361077 RepID=A0A151ZHY8_TIELA|nr:hypothetical protein DLAC_11608 [Tieghemostelium lacteum]|eukprot:KYQ93602.1 hypothetical protein DLAC_11608 [Tieghemostelium lacteum]
MNMSLFHRNNIKGQTVPVGEETANSGRARRNYTSPDHLISHIEADGVYTLYDSLYHATKKYGDKNVFAERKKESKW